MNSILEEDFKRILKALPNLVELSESHWLITGHAGFIGSYLSRFLCWLNDYAWDGRASFWGIDSGIAAGAPGAQLNDELTRRRDFMPLPWNMADGPPLERLSNARVDYVLHCASIAAPAIYKQYPLETIHVNVNGTENILNWARWNRQMSTESRIKSVLHFSSSEVYGDPLVIPTPESYWGNVSCTGWRACYDESKRLSETLCKIYHEKFAVPVKILRPHNIYGPGQRLDDGRVIPQLMTAMLENKPFTIYGDGSATRSYCYISDAVTQMLSVLFRGNDGEIYNVGDSDSEINLRDLAGSAGLIRKNELIVKFIVDSQMIKDAPTRRRPDTRKIREISPTPEVKLGEGLRRTYEYYAQKDKN